MADSAADAARALEHIDAHLQGIAEDLRVVAEQPDRPCKLCNDEGAYGIPDVSGTWRIAFTINAMSYSMTDEYGHVMAYFARTVLRELPQGWQPQHQFTLHSLAKLSP